MPTNLIAFSEQNKLLFKEKSFTSQLKRPFRSIKTALSPDYLVDLREKGMITEEDGKILEMFRLFRSLTIHQMAQFLYEQYSEEAHMELAESVGRLYYFHFLQPIDIEKKLKDNAAVYPLPSLSFSLGPAGARYLVAQHDSDLREIGWNKGRIITDQTYGMHNIIVTELIIRLTGMLLLMTKIPGVNIMANGINEWEGRIFPKEGIKSKVIARPDYSFQIQNVVQVESAKNQKPESKTFFMEYDNGTEPIDALIQKLVQYQLAFIGGLFPVGTPSNTNLLFIFNKNNRATKFAQTIKSTILKRDFSAIPIIYITTLDSIYSSGFLHDKWVKIVPPRLREILEKEKDSPPTESYGDEPTWFEYKSPIDSLSSVWIDKKLANIFDAVYIKNKEDMGENMDFFIKKEFVAITNQIDMLDGGTDDDDDTVLSLKVPTQVQETLL